MDNFLHQIHEFISYAPYINFTLKKSTLICLPYIVKFGASELLDSEQPDFFKRHFSNLLHKDTVR